MYKALLALLVPTLFACNNQGTEIQSAAPAKDSVEIKEVTALANDEEIPDLQSFKLAADDELSYTMVKKAIASTRVKALASNVSMDTLQAVFEASLLNRIIPFWEGTNWTFEGHTAKPQVGSIACGYFVSTTLQDAGLRVNRYKLAQQSPINEAKSLALQSELIEIQKSSVAENIKAISQRVPNGIHFIGFDQSHVGFLLKEMGELYLIHSNYVQAKGVEIEKIEASSAFSSYSRFYIVELSTNPGFLTTWLRGETVNVVTE